MSEQRGAKEAEHGDDYVNTILFTAGTALAMAYLKRAGLAMFVVEQWRIWVFLFLNVLLLAIVFSSLHNNSNNNNNNNNNSTGRESDVSAAKEKIKKKEEMEKEQCMWFEIENEVALVGNHGEGDKEAMTRDGRLRKISVDESEGDEAPRLSKEEVNERAEAFIMMFRQHLVSDAINGRSNHKRDNFQFSKHVQVHLLQVHG